MERFEMLRLVSCLVFVVTASVVACSPAPDDGCSSDAECKDARVCVDRRCADPAGSGGRSTPPTSPTRPPRTTDAMSPRGAEDADEWCVAYAEQCPEEGFDAAACTEKCSNPASMRSDDCWFRACGVEVGMCDNEEAGDETILRCGEQHGWLQ